MVPWESAWCARNPRGNLRPSAVRAALIRSIATTKSEAAWIDRAIEESEQLDQMMKDAPVGGILPV